MFDSKGGLAIHALSGVFTFKQKCMSQSFMIYETSTKYHVIKSSIKINGCILCNLLFVHVSHSSCYLFNT